MIAQDKRFHFLFCMGIAILLSPFPFNLWFYIPMLVGVIKEIYDLCGFGTFEWNDLLADLLGTVCGGVIGFCIKFLIQ